MVFNYKSVIKIHIFKLVSVPEKYPGSLVEIVFNVILILFPFKLSSCKNKQKPQVINCNDTFLQCRKSNLFRCNTERTGISLWREDDVIDVH